MSNNRLLLTACCEVDATALVAPSPPELCTYCPLALGGSGWFGCLSPPPPPCVSSLDGSGVTVVTIRNAAFVLMLIIVGRIVVITRSVCVGTKTRLEAWPSAGVSQPVSVGSGGDRRFEQLAASKLVTHGSSTYEGSPGTNSITRPAVSVGSGLMMTLVGAKVVAMGVTVIVLFECA
jgi:hypothetical protein